MRNFIVPALATLVLITALFGQNCGRFEAVKLADNTASNGNGVRGYYKKANTDIIQPQCVSCHSTANPGGGLDFSTYQKLMASGSIIANNSAGSSFVKSMLDGSMPPPGSARVPSDQIAFIESWIDHGALANEPPVANAGTDASALIPLPATGFSLNGSGTDIDGTIASYAWLQVSGPGTTSFSSTTVANPSISGMTAGTYVYRLTVTDNDGTTGSDEVTVTVANAVLLSTLNSTIFNSKCLSCHNNTTQLGQYNMATYSALMKDVVAGNASASKLYLRCIDNTMPPSSPLSQTEKDQIRTWINQGALNN